MLCSPPDKGGQEQEGVKISLAAPAVQAGAVAECVLNQTLPLPNLQLLGGG